MLWSNWGGLPQPTPPHKWYRDGSKSLIVNAPPDDSLNSVRQYSFEVTRRGDIHVNGGVVVLLDSRFFQLVPHWAMGTKYRNTRELWSEERLDLQGGCLCNFLLQ